MYLGIFMCICVHVYMTINEKEDMIFKEMTERYIGRFEEKKLKD